MSEAIGKATIEVGGDTTGLTTALAGGKRSLENLGKTATAAGREASAGIAAIAGTADRSAAQVSSASRTIADSLRRVPQAATEAAAGLGKLTAEQARFIQNTARTATLATEGRAAYIEQRAAVLGVSSAVADSVAKLRAAEAATGSLGRSAKATAAAMRNIPAQITDITTQLAGGQSPLLILTQQGGQLRDMFGGIGPALRAVGTYAAGLVNPFTVSAAAVAGLGFAMFKTEESLRASNGLAVQLRATGRSADFGREAAEALRKELALLPGVTRDIATGTIVEFNRTRQIGTAMFRELALTVADFAAATGTTAPEAAKTLAKAFADPAKGAKDLDDSLKVLSVSQLLTIQRLAEMGDRAGAQRVLLDALKVSIKGLADDSLTPLAKSTNELGNAWQRATSAFGDSSTIRGLNSLLATTVDSVSWLIDNSRKIPPGLLAYAAAGPTAGPVAAAAASALSMIGSANAATQTGGATGTWKASTEELDEHVKTLLSATASYKSNASAIDDLRGKARALTDTIAKLRSEGRGQSEEAKELQSRLGGVNEKLKELGRKSGAESQYNDLTERIRERIRLADEELKAGRPLTEAEKEQARISELLAGAKGKVTAAQKAGMVADLEAAKVKELAVAVQRSELSNAESIAKARQTLRNADYDQSAAGLRDISAASAASIASVRDQVESLQDEAKAAGIAAEQNITLAEALEQVRIARLRERQARTAEGGPAYKDLDDEIKMREQLLKGLGQQAQADRVKSVFASIDQTAQRVWTNVFDGGRDAFTKLGETLKASVLDLLYQLTLKKFIVNVSAQISGTLGTGAAQGGISSILGSASGAGSLLSGAGMFGSGLNAGFSSLFGEAGVSGAFSAGTTAIQAGNVAGGLGTLAGSAGPYVAAALLAYNVFNKKGGGPRASGYYGPNVEQHADNSLGAGLKTVVDQYDAQLQQILRAGGSTSAAQLGLSVSTDPRGTAQTHLANTATVNGAVVYHRWDGNVGRDEASLTAAIDSQVKESFLAALKASDIQGGIADYLRSIDVTSDVQGLYARVSKVFSEQTSLRDRLFDLTATDAQRIAKARDQERAAIDATNLSLLEQVYQQQDLAAAAEKAKAALADVTSALGSALSSYRTDNIAGIGRNDALAQIQAALAISKAGGPLPDAAKLKDAVGVLSRPDQNGSKSVADFVRQRDAEAALVEQLKQAYEGMTTAPIISAAQAAANQAQTTAATTAALQALQQEVQALRAEAARTTEASRKSAAVLEAAATGNATLSTYADGP